jgi:uncharacterized protein YciI
MKLVLFIFLFLFVNSGISQEKNQFYDSTLAVKLGADTYGMKSYVFVILKTGSFVSQDKEIISKSFEGHMANIQKLVAEKKLIVAGPFGKNDLNYRGLFIFDVASIDEVKKLVQEDPAVKIGLLDAEYIPWYGSAALPEYLPASDKIWKERP